MRRRVAVTGACAAVAMAAVGVFGPSIGAQSVPAAIEPISVVSAGSTPVAARNSDAAMSDTGAVVAFEASDAADRSDRQVWIRDRVAQTTRPVAEVTSAAPGISGNGCVVAYSVAGGDITAPTTALTVVDRCSAQAGKPLPAGTVVDTITATGQYSAPALSFDGSTIVWSTGADIRRYVSTATAPTHVLRHQFDATLAPASDVMTSGDVDISDDGTTVAFVAGLGTVPYSPEPANVFVWNLGEAVPPKTPTPTIELASPTALGDPGTEASTSPTLSADGSLLLFDSVSTDLAAVGTSTPTLPFVVFVDLTTLETRVLLTDASRPALSGDGLHAAYQRGPAVRVLSSTEGRTYTATADHPIDELVDANPTGAVSLSRYGRWVVFDSDDGAALTETVELQSGVMVWAADLKTAGDGSVLDTTTTTTTTTKPTTTTTTVAGNPPTPTTTVPAPVIPPTITLPRPPTTSTTWWRTARAVGSTRQRSTSSTSQSGSGVGTLTQPLVVEPASVAFDPTIIGAGRRSATVSLTNTGARTAALVVVRLEPAGATPFSIVADTCTGIALAAGAGCTVEVVFAPTDVGPSVATLSFEFADGLVLGASLVGDGSAEPILELVPAVAAPGQVVTVFGGGFPAGAAVELTHPGSTSAESVTVDADGSFAHVFVVLPRTPSGPAALDVAGQLDLFGDVTAELLVSSRPTGSAAAAFRDGVGDPFGR